MVSEDRYANGTHWIIPLDPIVKTPGGKTLSGYTGLCVWWDRDAKNKSDETLTIRQDNGDHADCLMMTLGQAYDLIDVLNRAVENA